MKKTNKKKTAILLFFLILFLLLLVAAGIFFFNGFADKEEQTTDQGNVTRQRVNVTIQLKEEETISGNLYLQFVDKEDTARTFSATLSEENAYTVLLSLPAGEYELASYYFSTGEDYMVDLETLKLKGGAEHTVKIGVTK